MFEPRMLANGTVCCSHPDALCTVCAAHQVSDARIGQPHDSVPDPYAAELAALRVAAQPPETAESRFAQRYRNMRMRALELEREQPVPSPDELRALAEHRAEVLTDLANYEPPNPYAPKERR